MPALSFKDKVDSTAKSIGANSSALFTTNQVRQMLKALLTGDFALADASFAEQAKQLLPTNEAYQDALQKYEEFINFFTEHLEVWKEASQVPPGIQHARLKQIRSRGYVCLTATGLNIIGRIGHELLAGGAENWQEYAMKLAKLDWQKTNPLWADVVQSKKDKAGNIVTEDIQLNSHTEKRPVMQIITNRGPLNRAIFKAMQAIGLTPVLPTEEPEPVNDAAAEVEQEAVS